MTKESLIDNLISQGVLKTPTIIQAFRSVDRADFVRPEYENVAYEDHPLPIGFDQTISQPLTVALMIEWLAPKEGDKILDVGCGSGWTTALLSSVVRSQGRVIGIERIPQLAEFAKSNLAKYPLLQRNSAIVQKDATKGYKEEAPFDKILASAAALDSVPKIWKAELKVGGRIVAPVGDAVVVIDKLSRNQYRQTDHWGFAFVPLVRDQ